MSHMRQKLQNSYRLDSSPLPISTSPNQAVAYEIHALKILLSNSPSIYPISKSSPLRLRSMLCFHYRDERLVSNVHCSYACTRSDQMNVPMTGLCNRKLKFKGDAYPNALTPYKMMLQHTYPSMTSKQPSILIPL